MILKPVTSEKAVRLIDIENTLVFEAPRQARKVEIKAAVEKMFSVGVVSVRTLNHGNKKLAYVKLAKENPAIDLATKLGMM
jgi:large subunit ribosomal protein L23